jgi:hypothetical protein
MAVIGYEGPDLKQPHVRTGAFCFITENASTLIDAPDRLCAAPRRICWESLAKALKRLEEIVEISHKMRVDTLRAMCYIAERRKFISCPIDTQSRCLYPLYK